MVNGQQDQTRIATNEAHIPILYFDVDTVRILLLILYDVEGIAGVREWRNFFLLQKVVISLEVVCWTTPPCLGLIYGAAVTGLTVVAREHVSIVSTSIVTLRQEPSRLFLEKLKKKKSRNAES